ncbi:MAG TPA: Obg family GTPase CgtA, partial [Solirubrobacterales bacterium]|nr:Obg family GTPase CgtA [Solirubrobacterales bacterium]
AYAVVRGELAAHGAGLAALPEIVVLSKRDLLPPDEVELELDAWRDGHPGSEPLAISAATGAGVGELVAALFRAASGAVPDAAAGGSGSSAPEFESEHRVYRPQGAGGFDVVRVGDGVFEVVGRGVEMLVERHDLANPEALGYLERRLHEIGVVKALRDSGFESGDEVRVGEQVFELE